MSDETNNNNNSRKHIRGSGNSSNFTNAIAAATTSGFNGEEAATEMTASSSPACGAAEGEVNHSRKTSKGRFISSIATERGSIGSEVRNTRLLR